MLSAITIRERDMDDKKELNLSAQSKQNVHNKQKTSFEVYSREKDQKKAG